MGNFNTIEFSSKIVFPELPIRVEPVFQTKDLNDSHYFTNFIVDESGKLMQNCSESVWVDDESMLFKGYYKTVREWTEHFKYNGKLNVYTNYKHIKYTPPESYTEEDWTFDDGWIEYEVQFVHGIAMVDNIKVISHEKPVMRSPEEAQAKMEEVLSIREERHKQYTESSIARRRDNPTPEQILIDDIYEHTDNTYIKAQIEEYRTKHDKYYEKAKQ
jgi:hypothetical protein